MIRTLEKPKSTATEVFTACISSQIRQATADLLAPLLPSITAAETEYRSHGDDMSLYAIESDFVCNEAVKVALKKVYDHRMAGEGKAASIYYDEIFMADGRKECPYCGIGKIGSLDHYLPKQRYLGLTVNPDNLIPACRDCQDEKKTFAPASKVQQVFHPYFEEFTATGWLFAKVINAHGPVVLFFADNRGGLNEELFERLDQHLAVFGLKERFKVHVASRLGEAGPKFRRHGVYGNPDALRGYLDDELLSVNDKIIWMRPYLEALRNSDWFCSEGFLQI